MRRRSSTLLALSLVVPGTLFGCGEDEVDLTVDVVSDWVPGLDFVAVQTRIAREPFGEGGDAETRQATFAITGSEAFVDGVRVAVLGDVGKGRRFVRVDLIDATGRPIASRVLDVTFERSFAATILLTRSCRDVECPAPAGAPELSECQAGECVDPRCSPSTPEFCPPPRCGADADCATPLAWCEGEAVCGRGGYCLCDDTGVLRDAGLDTGPACPATETVCSDGLDDDCDGLTDCADDDCVASACDDGFYCTTNDRCGADLACSDTEPTCPSFCNETLASCEECTADADCGAMAAGSWGACGAFTGACGESGTRSRQVTTPRCAAGTCVVETSTDTESCTRDTDGTSCMATANGSWGGCGGFSNACDTTGTQSRSVTTYACAGGSCAGSAGSESRSCSRSTNGAACNDGNPCTGPDRCSAGTCSDHPALPQHSTCGASHLRCCGSSCVDIRSDRSNCGGCGLACNPGFDCGARGGLPTCECLTTRSTCSGSTGSCSASTDLCSCDPMYGGSCPSPMTCYVMSGGADVCTY